MLQSIPADQNNGKRQKCCVQVPPPIRYKSGGIHEHLRVEEVFIAAEVAVMEVLLQLVSINRFYWSSLSGVAPKIT